MTIGEVVLALCAVVGAITGVGGLAHSLWVYRRQIASEKRDLRILVRERRDEVEQSLERFRDVHKHAHASRISVLVASNAAKSGARKNWERTWQADGATADELASHLPARTARYDGIPDSDIENCLVDLGQVKGQVDRLIAKYEGDIRADDAQRDRIQRAHLAKKPGCTSYYE